MVSAKRCSNEGVSSSGRASMPAMRYVMSPAFSIAPNETRCGMGTMSSFS